MLVVSGISREENRKELARQMGPTGVQVRLPLWSQKG